MAINRFKVKKKLIYFMHIIRQNDTTTLFHHVSKFILVGMSKRHTLISVEAAVESLEKASEALIGLGQTKVVAINEDNRLRLVATISKRSDLVVSILKDLDERNWHGRASFILKKLESADISRHACPG
jgi:hypothetical protein